VNVEQPSDHDEKSKTASATGAGSYPEQHEVAQQELPRFEDTRDEVSRLAYELWRRKGCPTGSAEEDWFEAVEQLRAKANSHNARVQLESGSVQH